MPNVPGKDFSAVYGGFQVRFYLDHISLEGLVLIGLSQEKINKKCLVTWRFLSLNFISCQHFISLCISAYVCNYGACFELLLM